MIISNIDNFSSMSTVKAKADIYLGTTLVKTCTCSDVLEKFKINRDGNTNKFFGFGVCHKLEVNFIDLDRELEISKANNAVICLGDGTTFDCPYPKFYINEVNRDEKTNSITATAYDKLYNASEHTLEEVTINTPYTVRQLLEACASVLGLTVKIENVSDASFNTSYAEGGNFDGNEDLRKVFDAIAEVTQTIYYLNSNEELVFKRLDKDGEAVHTVTKDNYYELSVKTAKKITGICSATELGDNLENTTGEEGSTQYVRNNPLWDLHPDRASLVDNAVSAIAGLTINQFNIDWSGDYRLEIGDKIAFINKENQSVTSFLLSDAIEYDGTFNQVTKWEYTDDASETPANATSIGDRINQTFARVDKVNQEITLRIDNVQSATNEQISALNVTTNGISTSVSNLQKDLSEDISELNNSLANATKQTSDFKQEADNALLEFKTEINTNGVTKVSGTGYLFDETGLTVSKTDAPTSTTISENGMTINNNIGTELLIANNQGVKATDLEATTYLKVGGSQFQYLGGRTACFWLGE